VGWPKRKCGICVSGEVKTNGAEVIELAKQKVVNGRRKKIIGKVVRRRSRRREFKEVRFVVKCGTRRKFVGCW
jgi:hypothetical protein